MGKNDKGPSKKTQEKQQNKVIEDRTFGLKNKKGAQTQKYVQQVQNSVKNQGMSTQKLMEMEQEKKKAQQKKEEEDKLLASLFKSVTSVKGMEKEEKEVDPKSLVCAFFKQGLCQKGKKCKYSHDLSLEQKTEQIDLYTDQRTQLFGGNQTQAEEDENCENWDVDKLNSVAKAQEQKYKNQKPTEIVCKFFLEAIEKSRYGWKWVCPNGMVCHYRHCLPPGYVLKKDIIEEKKEDSDLEEKLDQQIASLNHANGTKVTLAIFLEWKKKRQERKQKEREEKKQEDIKKVQSKGKNHIMSGRALFTLDPTLFQDDEEAADDYEREDSHHTDSEDEFDEDGVKIEKIRGPKEEYQELVFKEKEAGDHKPKGIQNEEEEEEKKIDYEEEKKLDEEPNQENNAEEQNKKKKKKKKKQSGQNVEVDDELFLE